MNVHDIREEEKMTEQAIADGETASHFDSRLTPGSNEGDDLLALFLGTSGDAAPASAAPPDLPPPPKSLYMSDLRYCEAALTRLQMLAAFGRHEAPVLSGVPGLAPDETVFVVSGLVPNRKSHPLVLEWIQETMTTERTPWLKVICVMVGEGTTVVTDSAATTPSRAGSAEDSRA